MRQVARGGGLGRLAGEAGGAGLLGAGSSGGRERTGDGKVRLRGGQDGDSKAASPGLEAKGRSTGRGLAKAAVVRMDSGSWARTGERRRACAGEEAGGEAARGGGVSASSVEKDTVLRRFLRGGRSKIGEEGRGGGGFAGHSGGVAVSFTSASTSVFTEGNE